MLVVHALFFSSSSLAHSFSLPYLDTEMGWTIASSAHEGQLGVQGQLGDDDTARLLEAVVCQLAHAHHTHINDAALYTVCSASSWSELECSRIHSLDSKT